MKWGEGLCSVPVAAVILPPSALAELLAAQIKDSKQLSSYRRLNLAEKLCSGYRLKIGFASTAEIDQLTSCRHRFGNETRCS